MKKRKTQAIKYESLPVILTFVMLFVFFGVALASMTEKNKQDYTMDKVSAFDLASEGEYSFVEVDEGNGKRYYVITKNAAQTTSALAMPDGSLLSKEQVTLPAAATTATTTDKATATTAGKTTVTTDKATATTTGKTTVTTEKTTASTSVPDDGNSKRRIAYLTFDDGPSENTRKILDILDKYNVKATFFVIYHKGMESEYKEIVNRGHAIALHSYTHSYRKIYKSEDAFFDDLQQIHDYVQSVTGVDSRIMRFPGGSSNTISNKYCKDIMKKLKPDVLERGYIYHDWNVDSTDAAGNNRDVEVLLKNVKKNLTSYRQVDVLMHDTGRMKQTTVEALPSIIEYIRSQGYEMEAITEDSKPIRHSW